VVQKNWTCLSVDNFVTVTDRKVCDMSKVYECCKENGPDLHSKAIKYILLTLHKYSPPPKFCQI